MLESIHNQKFTVVRQLVGKSRYRFKNDEGDWVKGAKFHVLESVDEENEDAEGQLTNVYTVKDYNKFAEVPLGLVEIDMQIKAGGKGEIVVKDIRPYVPVNKTATGQK